MNKHDFISCHYGNLAPGDRVAPGHGKACFEGKPPSRCSLSVCQEDGKTKYYCFSAGCGLGCGIVNADAFGWAERPTAPPPEERLPTVLPDMVRALPEDALSWLAKYSLTAQDAASYGLGYDIGAKRVVVPVYGPSGLETWQARAMAPSVVPKWLTPAGGTATAIFRSKGHPQGVVGFIVEDTISCMRVGKLFPCVAILGTYMPDHKARKILSWYKEEGLQRVVLLLDDDAYRKAIKDVLPVLTTHGICATVVRAGLGKDPKELTEEQLKRVAEHAKP